MTPREALEIVMYLATQNVIEDKEVMQDEEVLRPMQTRQLEAIAEVNHMLESMDTERSTVDLRNVLGEDVQIEPNADEWLAWASKNDEGC